MEGYSLVEIQNLAGFCKAWLNPYPTVRQLLSYFLQYGEALFGFGNVVNPERSKEDDVWGYDTVYQWADIVVPIQDQRPTLVFILEAIPIFYK